MRREGERKSERGRERERERERERDVLMDGVNQIDRKSEVERYLQHQFMTRVDRNTDKYKLEKTNT